MSLFFWYSSSVGSIPWRTPSLFKCLSTFIFGSYYCMYIHQCFWQSISAFQITTTYSAFIFTVLLEVLLPVVLSLQHSVNKAASVERKTELMFQARDVASVLSNIEGGRREKRTKGLSLTMWDNCFSLNLYHLLRASALNVTIYSIGSNLLSFPFKNIHTPRFYWSFPFKILQFTYWAPLPIHHVSDLNFIPFP